MAIEATASSSDCRYAVAPRTRRVLAQRGDRAGAAGVGVGRARGQLAPGRVDRDQRGGEGVHRDAGYVGPHPSVAGHRVEDLLDLRGHLVGVDDRGAVGRDREGLRHVVLQAVDPRPDASCTPPRVAEEPMSSASAASSATSSV
jgi:hypothetical protein